LFGQPIPDREQDIPALGEIRAPELERAARASLPAATMHRNEGGEWSRARRHVEIAGERNAVVGRISDFRSRFDLRRRHDQEPIVVMVGLPGSSRRSALFKILKGGCPAQGSTTR